MSGPPSIPPGVPAAAPAWGPAARRSAWIAGVFLTLAALWMLAGHWRTDAEDLLLPPEILAARTALQANPNDEAAKERIRALDQQLRDRYFRHLQTNAAGAWLLVAGLVTFVVVSRMAAAASRRPPCPAGSGTSFDETLRRTQRARLAVAAATVLVGVTLGIGAARERTRVPSSAGALQKLLSGPEGVPEVPPTADEWRRQWPQFRGPGGDGIATGDAAPLAWNGAAGEGVLWRVEVPVAGFNSPVVWGDRLMLTGGDDRQREVVCFSTATGGLLWRQAVPAPVGGFPRKPEVPEHTGYAASTAATDGRRVYAIFATGELAAFELQSGRLAWSQFLGIPENMYGHASSLVVWQDLLLVQFDHGEPDAGKSRLYGIEGRTGKLRWEAKRPVPSTWTTPLVASLAGRPQAILCGEPWVISYDPATGTELWRAECLGTDLAPSPVATSNRVVVCSPGKHVLGLRPDGQGDVTKTHVAWIFDHQVPDITSPIVAGDLVFLLTTDGVLACLEAASGKPLWEEALKLEFNASPVLVGQHLYLVSTEGVTLVVEAGRQFRAVARSELGEPVHASPAVVGGRLYLRGAKNLFGVGAPAATAAAAPPSHGS